MMRYEKMSNKEIFDAINQCFSNVSCESCERKEYRSNRSILGCNLAFLKDGYNPVPRWKTIRTQDDLDRLHDEFVAFCMSQTCSSCQYDDIHLRLSASCFRAWLSEPAEE